MNCSDKAIGKRVANLRKDAGMTQSVLAEAVGLSRTILAKVETGGQPLKPDQLFSIAKVLGVTVDFLVSGVATENVTVADDLGLSQGAIESLKFLKNSSVGSDILSALNMLLECESGQDMLETVFHYLSVNFSNAEYNVTVDRFVDGQIVRTDYNVPHGIEQLTFKNDSGKGIEIPVSMLRFAMLEAIKNDLNRIREQVRNGGEK